MPEQLTGATDRSRTAFLFDLDGTLVDSVYQHVLAWREAMAKVGVELAVWTVHRRIGMSGGLMNGPEPAGSTRTRLTYCDISTKSACVPPYDVVRMRTRSLPSCLPTTIAHLNSTTLGHR